MAFKFNPFSGTFDVVSSLADLGITATATEINVLDNIPATLTSTELGYVDGVTSAIQTQLDGKAAQATRALQWVATTTLGADAANIEISGISETNILVVIMGEKATSGQERAYIYFNQDTTDANYYCSGFRSEGTNHYNDSSGNTPTMGYVGQGTNNIITISAGIKGSKLNSLHDYSTVNSTTQVRGYGSIRHTGTIAAITAVRAVWGSGNAIKSGTTMTIYRRL